KCHNSTLRTANVVLDHFNPEQIGDTPELWERVVRRLRLGLHRPIEQGRPSQSAVAAFSASVEAVLDRTDQANWAPGVAEPISDVEIATRMAKFLWNGEPDQILLKLAEARKLRDRSTLEQQVRRMITDSRSSAFFTDF